MGIGGVRKKLPIVDLFCLWAQILRVCGGECMRESECVCFLLRESWLV
jgi:hypothetical protein